SVDAEGAQKVLENALEEDPQSSELLEALERIAERSNGFASAVAALERALGDAEGLPSEALIRLWVVAANWYENRLQDLSSSERALGQARVHGPKDVTLLETLERVQRSGGNLRGLVDTLRARATLEGGTAAQALRRDAHAVAVQPLADIAL